MSITHENRRESYLTVLETLKTRQEIVLQILKYCGDMTEVATELKRLGITQSDERNLAAPRLTELCGIGLVEIVGKKVCGKTGRKVTVYSAIRKQSIQK